MVNNITRYLFDANAIRCLNYASILKMRNANTVLETTSDINLELGDRAIQKRQLLMEITFDGNVYSKMIELLEKHQCVRNLLDYYNNKGMGDVGVMAYALVADDGKLIKDNTIIVTDDAGVMRACKDLKLTFMNTGDFKTK